MLNSLVSILSHPCNKNKQIITLVKLVWWKINQIIFKYPTVVELVPDVKCICYPNSSYGGMVVYTRLPEYNELNYFINTLKDDSIVIDVGANIGVYSLIAAKKAVKGKVYSFEPLEKPLTNFKENIAINGFEQVIEINNSVISDQNGYEYFSEQDESEVSHIAFKATRGTKIKSITLDSFIKANKLKRIDLVKIDVEGAELKVLKGMKESLNNKMIKTIIMEINENERKYGYSPQDVFELLSKYSYKPYILDENSVLKEIDYGQVSKSSTFNIVAIS